jgi:hypothetical protein
LDIELTGEELWLFGDNHLTGTAFLLHTVSFILSMTVVKGAVFVLNSVPRKF